jgi:hypothetical protein
MILHLPHRRERLVAWSGRMSDIQVGSPRDADRVKLLAAMHRTNPHRRLERSPRHPLHGR